MAGGAAGGGPRTAAMLLALLVGVAVPVGGLHGAGLAPQAAIDADTVLLDVDVREDGTAAWEIRYRVRLSTDNETAAFESLARDVEANRSAYEDRFADRIGGTVAAAENATGREMAVRNLTVRTTQQSIPQRYGVLVYAFEWTGFATTEDGTIRAGDAIGGLYLDGATTLTIRWPAAYAPTTVSPEPDERGDRSATWRGPADFTTEQPRIAVAPAGDGQSDPAGDGQPEPDPASDGGTGVPPILLALLALLLAALLVAGGWWWRRPDGGDGAAGASDAAEEPPEELLSNEERVVRLLREHGGRMKQQQVVEELGWTDAKTSQVVGDLREAGEIEGFRLGRENVLRLPEVDDEDLP